MKTITADGVKYVSEADFKSKKGNVTPSKRQIVILQRGWVAIGNYSVKNDECLLTDAAIIRTWGTTKGLGELVNGPLRGTKLDSAGTVKAPMRALISLIDVEQAKWKLF